MQFYQLKAFVKVADRKSFSRAAEDLYLSQSTVSIHVSSLEKYFSQKLFDRLGKEVALTPFGQKMYYWAREILKARESALWELKEWTGKTEGRIHIGGGTVPAQYMLPYLVSQFSKKYPGIEYLVTKNSSQLIAESLLQGETDLGVLGEKYYEDKLDYLPYMEEKLVLITPKETLMDNPVSLFNLLEYPFIFRKAGSGTQAVLEKIFKKEGVNPSKLKVPALFNNVESIKQGVKAGLGFSIISEIAARDYQKIGFLNTYELKEINEKRSFYFACNYRKTMAPYVEEFINFCLQMDTSYILP